MDNKRTGKQIHGHKLRCDYILHVVCMCVAICAILPVFVHVHTLTCRHTAQIYVTPGWQFVSIEALRNL